MRLLFKNTIKKIKNSFGRFLSIMFIIAVGISVFIGLRESTAGILYTADNYYDKYNLMDAKIISSYGLTEGDVESIKKLDNSLKVIPSYSVDVLSNGEAIRIHAIEEDVNNVELVNGVMPKNNNECLADFYNYSIGEVIYFEKKDLNDFIKIDKCKVVGTIKSVLYVRDEKGISSVGNGKLSSFIFVNKDAFNSKYYTEIYVIGKGTLETNSYYDNYKEKFELLNNELELLKPIRETIRYEEVLKEANDEIIKIKKELKEETNKANKKLNETKSTLDKASDEINKAEETFTNQYKSLNDSKSKIISSLESMNINENELSSVINELSNNINLLKGQLALLDENSEEYNNILNRITELESKYKSLNEASSSLNSINDGLSELDTQYSEFVKQTASKKIEIAEGYTKYNEGLLELNKKVDEANKKIENATDELSTLERPVWYLMDRTDNSGYVNYKEDTIKVEAIAKVLPVFFILVVMLMTSNTLTRLIEEERTEMGILESNGYSKSSIVLSYLLYVFISGLLGLAIGLTIGYSIIPKVVYGVFLSRYYVPKLITVVSPLPFSLVFVVTLLLLTVVTIISCYRELREVPAELLRPKAPKDGKKVLLENNKFIWNKLSFMWKVTVRNIFRYKKRIIMTILGVAGCTALLLTGMGLNDSINTISKVQYDEIIKYDAIYVLGDPVEKIDDELNKLFKKNNISNPLLINQSAYTFSYDNKIGDVYLVVPSDEEKIYDYVNLEDEKSNKILFDDDGVIITEQLANLLNVSVGDTISIRNSDNELFLLYVSGITQNYVSHYIYINKVYYNEIFGDLSYNSIIANGEMNSKEVLTDYNILMSSYTKDIVGSFDSFVKGMNKIIVMIIVCACILALVVLYNLTIINVSERKREIATLKVLGFDDKEISSFIYRETFMLTIFGIIFGLVLGVFLHKFVISTAQTDNIMFLKSIKWYSYIISAIITIIFSFIVQLIINKVLKRIDMIDSLKSVE